jgi:hypothetical protein
VFNGIEIIIRKVDLLSVSVVFNSWYSLVRRVFGKCNVLGDSVLIATSGGGESHQEAAVGKSGQRSGAWINLESYKSTILLI